MSDMISDMYDDDNIKRITINLPKQLLTEVVDYTGKNITDTITMALQLLKRARAYKQAMSLKGKIKLDIDLGKLRERTR